MRTPFLPLSMFMAVFTANGQSWTVLPTATSYDLQDVWSLPQHPDTGVVCGSYLDGAEILPFAMRTTNGGVTMVPQDVSFGGNFTGAFAMDFVEGNTGYMCGGGVLATYNGGQGWGQLVDVFEVNGTLYDVDALTTEDVYAVGEAFDATGMAMVTHDGWNNWATSIISDVNDDENTFMTAVVRATANRLYAGASAGISGMPTLFLSTDDGLSWSAVNFTHGVNDLWASQGDTIFAASDAGIYQIAAAGTSIVPKQLTNASVRSLDIKLGKGFAVCADGSIYASADGGNNWSPMVSPVMGTELNAVRFANAQRAYACGAVGTLLRWDGLITGLEPIAAEGMGLAPNPATDHLRLQANTAARYTIHDASGHLVASGRLLIGINNIPLAGLAPGLHVVRSGDRSQRFLKE